MIALVQIRKVTSDVTHVLLINRLRKTWRWRANGCEREICDGRSRLKEKKNLALARQRLRARDMRRPQPIEGKNDAKSLHSSPMGAH
jgi:hypothetical protein